MLSIETFCNLFIFFAQTRKYAVWWNSLRRKNFLGSQRRTNPKSDLKNLPMLWVPPAFLQLHVLKAFLGFSGCVVKAAVTLSPRWLFSFSWSPRLKHSSVCACWNINTAKASGFTKLEVAGWLSFLICNYNNLFSVSKVQSQNKHFGSIVQGKWFLCDLIPLHSSFISRELCAGCDTWHFTDLPLIPQFQH